MQKLGKDTVMENRKTIMEKRSREIFFATLKGGDNHVCGMLV